MRFLSYAFATVTTVLPITVCGCTSSKDDNYEGIGRIITHYMNNDDNIENSKNVNTTTKTLALKNFHGIEAKSAVWVEYTQGSEYKVVFEGSEKSLSQLDIKVENGILVINDKGRNSWEGEVNRHWTLYITAPHIDHLNTKGVLNFDSKKMKEDKMAINVSGVLKTYIDLLECNTFEIINSGVMNYDGKVKAKSVNIHTSGVDKSDASYETDDMTMKVSGVSNADIKIKGGTVNLNCSGVGNTTLTLDCNKLDVNASGYLNLELKGVADKVNISGSGVSNVTQKELNKF